MDSVVAVNQSIAKNKRGILNNNGYGYASYNDLHKASVAKNYNVQSFSLYIIEIPEIRKILPRAKTGLTRWVGVVTGSRTSTSKKTSTTTTGSTSGSNTGGTVSGTYSDRNSAASTDSTTEGSDGDIVTSRSRPSCACCAGKLAYEWKYYSWVNKCPFCGKAALVPNNKAGNKSDGQINCATQNGGCDADFCGACGGDTHVLGDKAGDCRTKYLTPAGQSDGTESSSTESTEKSSFLSGEETFKELIDKICNATDTLFLCKKSHIHITDIPSLFAQATYLRQVSPETVESEDVKLWQLEDGSYTLNIDQYGFYNTVYVVYKNGVWKESYPDLVKVYSEVPITYTHKSMDKYQAMAVAKSYLAAHLRDFGMTITAKILYDGSIDIGDLITLENPLTMKDYIKTQEGGLPDYLFVKGLSVDWEGDAAIYGDLELSFAPTNPDNPEVAEVGVGGASATSVDEAVKEVLALAGEITYKKGCGADYGCVVRTQTADCYGMSIFIKTELENRGVTAQIRGYPAYSPEHRSVLYKDDNGKWQRFPYRDNPKLADSLFVDTDKVWSGRVVT